MREYDGIGCKRTKASYNMITIRAANQVSSN